MEAAAKRFFTSPYFAVAGASQDKSKFGYKILAWYAAHSLQVTPINPSRSSIQLFNDTNLTTVSSALSLPHPSETSLSLVTPPPITLRILKEAKEAGVKAVWLQPGSFDKEVLDFATREFEAGVGGDGGRGGEGWCVLVDGEAEMRAVGRTFERL
ncbi:hypothetical protein MMC19_005233 [Ptychographa xylographoides]|nr:hypothetical protein [Ptychographa xylographoides]